MILQVHDELVFEVNEDDVALLSEGVRFRMASAAALDVPLVVDVGVGITGMRLTDRQIQACHWLFSVNHCDS